MKHPVFLVTALVAMLTGVNALGANTGWLGAEVGALTPAAQTKTHGAIASGAMISSVVQGGPAAKAGLKAGEIVTFADGRPISGPSDLVRIVGSHAAGETMVLMVVNVANGFSSRYVTVGLSGRPQSQVAQSQKPGAGHGTKDEFYTGFNDFKPPPEGTKVLKDPDYDPMKGMEFDPGPDQGANAKSGSNAQQQMARASGKKGRGRATGRMASAGGAHFMPVGLLRGQYCHALAPAGWRIGDQTAQGTAMSVVSADGRMRAAYVIVGINSGAALMYVRPQGGDPFTQAMTLSSLVAGQQIRGISQQQFMGARLVNFRGASQQGYVLFRTYPVPGQPYSYVLSTHIASGPTQREEGIAGAVASTINCTAQFRPPAGGYAQVQPRSSSQATGTSSRCQAGNCDDGDLAGTYNVQLGTGYVHSETGQNYLVDPATDYQSTGPDGPGYYRSVGNSYEKLTPGWSG